MAGPKTMDAMSLVGGAKLHRKLLNADQPLKLGSIRMPGSICTLTAKMWGAIACFGMFITMVFTYTACVKQQECPPIPHLPTISNTWDNPPGNFLSRFVVSNVAFCLAACQIILWVPVSKTKKCEKLCLALGLLGILGFSIVGAVCDDDKDPECRGNNTLHSVCAVFFFVTYNMNMALLSCKSCSSHSICHSAVLHAFTLLSLVSKARYVPSQVGLNAEAPMDQTLLALFEWTDVFAIMGWTVYFLFKSRPDSRASLGPSPSNPPSSDTTYGELSAFSMAITVLVLFFGTLASCLAAAYLEGRVPKGTWPYISDLFVYPPGNWISRWAVVLGCTLSIYLMVFLHSMDGDSSKCATMTTGLSIVAILGLDVVGCVNESEMLWLHLTGAVVFFGGFDIYMVLRSMRLSRHSRFTRNMLRSMAFASTVLSAARLHLHFQGIISSLGAILEWANALVIIGYTAWSIFAHGDTAKSMVLRLSGPAPAGLTDLPR